MRIALCILCSLLLSCITYAQTNSKDSLEVHFEPQGGFYDEIQSIQLSSPHATDIYYTLDGSLPNKRSHRYVNTIFIDESSVLRVRAYDEDKEGLPQGETYFINEPSSYLPTVSIGINKSILFSPSRGIFVQGNNAVDSLWHKPGANFWTRREYAVHIDMYEQDGEQVYNSLTGLRLFGGMSRLFPQKSLALVARKQYGAPRFKHNFFGKDVPKKQKFLILRNSGSDFGKTHFRDGLMTSLVNNWDLETQAFRAAQVYINGKYWGIYNIREKVNRFFIEDHAKGIDRDSIDILEHYAIRKRGHRYHYREMLDFLERYDLHIEDNYQHLQNYMEVENFMQYQIAQIYFDNRDAGGNIKYWRPQTEDGRWRWILYDTDWGFGLHSDEAYRNNSIAFHTKPNGPHWPNPPWSTFILRKLLKNDSFKKQFVNRFADHLNSSFKEEVVEQKIDSFFFVIQQDMPRHLERWRLEKEKWLHQVEVLRNFAEKRPTYVRSHLDKHFDTGENRSVSVTAGAGGKVLVNDYYAVSGKYKGIYFQNYPISLRATPNYGYRFVGWTGDLQGTERVHNIDLSNDEHYQFKAQFEAYTHPLSEQIVINEICAKGKHTGDWVEIHNRSEELVNLKDWVLTDARNEFTLPDVELLPNDYLVICKDAKRFREQYPEAYNVVSGLSFGISKYEEVLCLYSQDGAAVDSVAYQITPLDTVFTLSLAFPDLDNANFDHWEIQTGFGTPNAANPQLISGSIRFQQSQWMQIGIAASVFILGLIFLGVKRKQKRE